MVSSGSEYVPSDEVWVVRVSPVDVFFADTVAWAMAAPLESLTVPMMEPRKVCADAGRQSANPASSNAATHTWKYLTSLWCFSIDHPSLEERQQNRSAGSPP